MPTNQYTTQTGQQVSSQPKWYQYISPYIEGASKTMENVNKRKEAYMKAFKAYMAEAAEQAKNYGSNAVAQIKEQAPKVVDKAKSYASEKIDAVKDFDYTFGYNGPQPGSGDKPLPKPARPYRRETLPDVLPWDVDYNPATGAVKNLAQPAATLLQDAAHKWLYVKPMNALGFTPKSRTLTNRDFSEGMKSYADSVVVSKADREYPGWRERTANGDTIRILVNGSDYVPNYGGSNKTYAYRLVNPQGQTEHVLGSWNAEITKDHIIHNDVYDFKDIKMKPGGSYNKLRSDIIPVTNTLDTQPENEKLKIQIKRRRIPQFIQNLRGE